MLTLLIMVVAGYLFFRRMRRVGGASSTHRPGEGPGSGPDWKPLIDPLRQRLGRHFAVAAVLGCGAVVAGGYLWGLWGLIAGTLVVAGGLAWVVLRPSSLRVRRIRRSRHRGELTEDERLTFEQIVANLTADD